MRLMTIVFLALSLWGCKTQGKNTGVLKQEVSSTEPKFYYLASVDEYNRDTSKTILNTYMSATSENIKAEGTLGLGIRCWAVGILLKKEPTLIDTFGKLLKNNDTEAGKQQFQTMLKERCTDPKQILGFASLKTNKIDQEAMNTIASDLNRLVFTQSFNDDDIFSSLGDSLAKTGACVMDCSSNNRFCKDNIAADKCQRPEQALEIFNLVPKCPFTLKYYGGISCARIGIKSVE